MRPDDQHQPRGVGVYRLTTAYIDRDGPVIVLLLLFGGRSRTSAARSVARFIVTLPLRSSARSPDALVIAGAIYSQGRIVRRIDDLGSPAGGRTCESVDATRGRESTC